LNKLGTREPDVYGTTTYKELEEMCIQYGKDQNVTVDVYQSNHEGDLIDKVQEVDGFDALIINPAAYSHTSIALLDALTMVEKPIVEVHFSNVYKREHFRHNMVTAKSADAVVSGFGAKGYLLALSGIVDLLIKKSS